MLTTTERYLVTTTSTRTVPGSTTYEVTITKPQTFTSLEVTDTHVTSTVWEKGCETWACQM